jgi:peptidoglycan/LPS O-acetylase OafA/YrhL
MLLSHILRKENNNLDIFRIIAAAMVIYGHAYALLPKDGSMDLIGKTFGFDYSGSLAVKIFFFLSGLVVTNSLMQHQNIKQFLISRFFRIWPAFIVVLAAMAFFVGPIISKHNSQEYFSNTQVYGYFFRSILMDVRFDLPGVFQNNVMKSANGSLWSIPLEIYAYILLILACWSGLLKNSKLSIGLFLIILVDPLIGNKLLFTWLPQNPEITMLAPCFAAGSLFALLKEKINVNIQMFFACWILLFLFKKSSFNFYFLYLALFVSILFLASLDFMIKIKPSSDISYGLYLWGWPVQQVLAQLFPEYGIRFNQVASIAIAACFGFASWHLIEKHFIKTGLILKNKIIIGDL